MHKKTRFGIALVLLSAALLTGSFSQTQNLYSEAQSQASKFWLQRFKRCGDSFLSKSFIGSKPNQVFMGYREWKNLTWRVESRAITEADRLNGVEWLGYSWISASAVRDTNKTGKNWSPWMQGVKDAGEIKVLKKNGQWKLASQVSSSYETISSSYVAPATCEEVSAHQTAK